MTTLTKIPKRYQRECSIVILDHIRSLSYSRGDWKDSIASFSYILPSLDKLPGLTSKEYSVLEKGETCPKMASDMLASLLEELNDICAYSLGYKRKLERLRKRIQEKEKEIKFLKSLAYI
jgi:vacuolar-type H+-ATPase subunit I/STV1